MMTDLHELFSAVGVSGDLEMVEKGDRDLVLDGYCQVCYHCM
jgi:hypothetical protein